MTQVLFDTRDHIRFFEDRLQEIERWLQTHHEQMLKLEHERDAIRAAIDALTAAGVELLLPGTE